jgi:TolA-binding protein
MKRTKKLPQKKLANKSDVASKSGEATSPTQTGQEQIRTVQQAIDSAVQHHQAGDLPKAETIYQQILQANPNQPIALHF